MLTVDCPVLELFSKSIQNQCNRVFVFDYKQYQEIAQYNPDNIYYFPLAVNINQKQTVIKQASFNQRKHFSSDISFIGSTCQEKCKYNQIQNLPEYIKGYVDGLIYDQMNIYSYNLLADSMSEQFCKEFKKYADWGNLPKDYEEDSLGLIADCYIGEKCTEQERIRTLQNISEHFDMDIYTTSDMSAIPKIHNRGIADSVTMMPKIFQCSRINLNMTNRPIRSGLPQRIFDIMGAGGFLLTHYQPELTEYFEIGKEVAVYESQQDLLEKIAYYLEHEDERVEIAANGRRAIEKNHQYAQRLQMMFEVDE